jgi:hypothetical protein
MEFKAGDKVKRKTYDMDGWWNGMCEDANVKPDHVFTVSKFLSKDDLYLEGIEGCFDSFRFALVASPTDMESEYQRALELVGKKIVVGKDKYGVQNVLFRRGNDRDHLSCESIDHLAKHGWVVSVVFCGTRNLPVSMAKEAPITDVVKLNDLHNAIVTKETDSGTVMIGGMILPITKIQEIIDAYNKL